MSEAEERAAGSAPVSAPAPPAADPRPVVLFDLDGVLTRHDTFAGFVARRLLRGPHRLALALPLVPFMLLPATRRPAATLLVRLALTRMSVARYRAAVAAHAARMAANPKALHPDCVREARRHLDAGARVIFVTASEEALARALLDRVGLPEVELVASRLRRSGRAWHVALHNHGEEKPRQLLARGIAPPWEVAYSDHAVDLPMLRGARTAILVNPRDALLARARRELSGEVRTARWPAGLAECRR